MQNVAANVGGIIKFLVICGEMTVWYFRNIRYKEFLMNIFFDEDDIKAYPVQKKAVIKNMIGATTINKNSTTYNNFAGRPIGPSFFESDKISDVTHIIGHLIRKNIVFFKQN